MGKGGLEVACILHRAALACIWRFNQLTNVEKLTGSAEILCLVKRAKEIKDAIDWAEVIGYVEMNDHTNSDSDADDDDDDKCLPGTNLADNDGKLRRPEIKKQKVDKASDALNRMTDQQASNANIIAQALENLADKMCSSMDQGLSAKVVTIDSKLDMLLEKLSSHNKSNN